MSLIYEFPEIKYFVFRRLLLVTGWWRWRQCTRPTRRWGTRCQYRWWLRWHIAAMHSNKTPPQGQLTENGHRLDKLRADFRRYQGWLEEADGSPASTLSIRTGNGTSEASPRRSSVSDEVESLSRSASDSSVNHNKNGSLVTSIISQGWVKSGNQNHRD